MHCSGPNFTFKLQELFWLPYTKILLGLGHLLSYLLICLQYVSNYNNGVIQHGDRDLLCKRDCSLGYRRSWFPLSKEPQFYLHHLTYTCL